MAKITSENELKKLFSSEMEKLKFLFFLMKFKFSGNTVIMIYCMKAKTPQTSGTRLCHEKSQTTRPKILQLFKW